MAEKPTPKLTRTTLSVLMFIALAVAVSSFPAFAQRDVDVPPPPLPPHPPLSIRGPLVPAPPRTPRPPAPPQAPLLSSLDAFHVDLDLDPIVDVDDDLGGGADEKGERRSDGRLSVDELIALRIHDVTPEYIDEMRATFPDASLRQIASMRMHGVTTAYVRGMRAAGVQVRSSRDAARLRQMGVTPAFVKQLAEAGYRNLSVRELTRLAAAGVDADFISDLEKYKDKKR